MYVYRVFEIVVLALFASVSASRALQYDMHVRWSASFHSFLCSPLLRLYMRSPVWRRYKVGLESASYEVFQTFFSSRTDIRPVLVWMWFGAGDREDRDPLRSAPQCILSPAPLQLRRVAILFQTLGRAVSGRPANTYRVSKDREPTPSQ